MGRVIIFDTTLRDGEQSPGATMSLQEKLTIAEMLERMGVDVIEAGFAASSPGDAECIREVSKYLKNATICSLARAKKRDIEAAAEALKYAKKPRIHTFISTSKIQIEHQLKVSEDQVLEMIDETVRYAKSFFSDIEWSAMDATRTDMGFLLKAVRAAVEAGATTVNIPDTVGYTMPDEYRLMIKTLSDQFPKTCFSVHCHNDLGIATANSLAGVLGGARQIECTVNGIGERAGNAALEEIAMILKTRPDVYSNITTGIETTMIWPISRFVAAVTGFSVQKNKAIVGANAFAHESGIHQDGMLKNRQTYEIISPESVGVHKSLLVLGKHSGRAAIKDKISEWGLILSEQEFESFFARFKELCDRKKNVTEEDILSILRDQVMLAPKEAIKLVSLATDHQVNGSAHSANIVLSMNGKEHKLSATGNGPLDAIFNAIQAFVKVDPELDSFEVHSLSQGADAQAEANVTFRYDDRVWAGHARDTDTLLAATKAYIYAVNKILAKGSK